MLYKAKVNGDIGVKGCKVVGIGEIFGYELIQNFFVDNSGFGQEGETALTFGQFLNQVKAGLFYGIRDTGQFQVNIGEYKKVNRQKFQANLGIVSSKLISKSCRVINYKNGDKTIRLYSTDILQFKGDKIILNSGGFKTTTTKARINQFLPGNIGVYQKDYKWYIANKGKILEFSDNIEIEL